MRPAKYADNGKTVIVLKNRSVGATVSQLPIFEYKVQEGAKEYYVHQYDNDDVIWYLQAQIHRELGPACEWGDGGKVWYLYGSRVKCSTQEEFERILKLKAFW